LAKASIDQWLEAEGQSFNPPSSTLVFQLAFAPRMKIKQDQGAIRQSKEKLKKVLDVYDKRLGETRYLAGDEFTLADLSHLPNIHYLVAADADTADLFTSSSRNNVSRWWTEISTRESWKKVIDLHPKPWFINHIHTFGTLVAVWYSRPKSPTMSLMGECGIFFDCSKSHFLLLLHS